MRSRLCLLCLAAATWSSTGCSDVVEPQNIDCTQFPDGTECDDPNDDVRQVCLGGTCRLSACGDDFVDIDSDEDCEPKGDPDPTCNGNCTFVCTEDLDCDDGNECTEGESCAEDHSCLAGTNLAGASCTLGNGDPGVCALGLCVRPGCNDGILDESEECDDGNTQNGDGCDADCTFSCKEDSDCDDLNPCTGVETCNTTGHVCVPGTATECPRPDACTISTCNPETGLCEDSIDPSVDADGDGFATDTVPGCGDDCDDTDPDMNPGEIEVCGDGKDNNCFDGTMDEAIQTWWADCDGDGFAADGAITMTRCAKPNALSAGCPEGFGDWTPVNPNSLQTRDCADLEASAFPGAADFHAESIPGTSSYDWNCDTSIEQRWPECGFLSCFFQVCLPGRPCCDSMTACCSFGQGCWQDGSAPSCGNGETWENCGDESLGFCAPDSFVYQECR